MQLTAGATVTFIAAVITTMSTDGATTITSTTTITPTTTATTISFNVFINLEQNGTIFHITTITMLLSFSQFRLLCLVPV